MFLYIDPTTGGLGIQLILGFLVGGFVTLKLFLSRFLSFFRRGSAEDETPATVPVESASDE
jgi:hypothetical protein